MNLASTLRVCLHFDGENEAGGHEPGFRRAHRHTDTHTHTSENIISASFTPFTWWI